MIYNLVINCIFKLSLTAVQPSCVFRPHSCAFLCIPVHSCLIPVYSCLIPVDSCGFLWNPEIPEGICGAVRSTACPQQPTKANGGPRRIGMFFFVLYIL